MGEQQWWPKQSNGLTKSPQGYKQATQKVVLKGNKLMAAKVDPK